MNRTEILALVAMAFGVFMDGLDASIVNIALPSIAESFGTDANSVAWVTITYFMMIAGLMLTFGRLADSGHIKKIYICGFGLFTIASLMCGLSDDLTMLVASRVVQGVGAAMLGAVAPMICVKFLPESKLSTSMSVLMLSGAIGFGSGPAVGGIIIDMASWHWAFFINVPIGIIAILFALKALPDDHDIDNAKLDLAGSAALFITVITGVYVLEMFSRDDQQMICTIMGIVMVISLILFIILEKRARHPMLNLGMFRDWRFDSSVLCYLILNLVYMGISYVLPFYLTKELELGYTFSGLLILVPSLVVIAISLPTGRYADVHGRRMLSLISTSCLLLSSIGYYMINPDLGWWPFIPIGILSGIVWGLCGASVASRIVDLAPESERGMASTLSNFLYYTGGSVGTALFASLVTFGSGTSGIPIDLISPVEFMDGYVFAMLIAVFISIFAIITAWIIDEKKINPA